MKVSAAVKISTASWWNVAVHNGHQIWNASYRQLDKIKSKQWSLLHGRFFEIFIKSWKISLVSYIGASGEYTFWSKGNCVFVPSKVRSIYFFRSRVWTMKLEMRNKIGRKASKTDFNKVVISFEVWNDTFVLELSVISPYAYFSWLFYANSHPVFEWLVARWNNGLFYTWCKQGVTWLHWTVRILALIQVEWW